MKQYLKTLTDDEFISLLRDVVDLERQLNSELERRAQLCSTWPALIVQAANDIYRGYVRMVEESAVVTNLENEDFDL